MDVKRKCFFLMDFKSLFCGFSVAILFLFTHLFLHVMSIQEAREIMHGIVMLLQFKDKPVFSLLCCYSNIDFQERSPSTVCPGSSDPTYNIESNYFIQSNSCDLKLFCSANE